MQRKVPWDELLLAAFALASVLLYWWFKRFRVRIIGGPASAAIKQCNSIAADGLSHFLSIHLLYSGFQMPYCTVRFLTGGSAVAWIGVQLLLWAATVVFVYQTGRLLVNRAAGLVSGFSLAVLWETFRFAVRPQSDMMGIFALAFALWALARVYTTVSSRNLSLTTVSLILLSVSRPVGFPVVAGVLLYQALGPRGELVTRIGRKTTAIVAIVVGIVAAFAVTQWFLPGLSAEYTTQEVGWRSSYLAAWANGIIVTHTTEPTFQYLYDIRSASTVLEFVVYNIDHIIVMALMKGGWLFVPALTRWSTFHIVVNIVTLVPLTVGTVAGVYGIVTEQRSDLLSLWVVPFVCLVVPIMMTYVDGGFNYRAPLTLLFALFTGYALRDSVLIQESLSLLQRAKADRTP